MGLLKAIWKHITGVLTPLQVEVALDSLAVANPERLEWRTSIVDLLKLIGIDSGLLSRRDLAIELGYKGTAADGSAEKNQWLHKEVLRRISELEIVIPVPAH